MSTVPRAAQRALAALRRELEHAFGWTHVDVELDLGPQGVGIVARGTVVAPRVTRRLRAALLDAVPDGWPVDTSQVRALTSGDYRALPPGPTPLWRKHPSRERVLSTELLPEDGPVELLARHAGACLVRAMDATVGWMEGALGERTPPPRIEPAHGTADAVVAAARALLDAPYRLGGATAGGIDCSALVQRAFARGLGVRLPRHSTDQLAATLVAAHAPEQSGDLVFAWTLREGPCHVGIAVEGEPMTVIHASLSRRRVVEDPLDRFLEGAERREGGALARILDFHETNVGQPRVELPLGEDP